MGRIVNRMFVQSIATMMVLVALGSAAFGAIVLDQSQIVGDEEYSGEARYTRQQGVKAGIAGVLVGFEVWSDQVGSGSAYINLGTPFQTDVHQWTGAISSGGLGWDYVDVSAANIIVSVGTQFVIGLNGADQLSFRGTSIQHPGDAYAADYPHSGAFAYDSLLDKTMGPFTIVSGQVYHRDLAFRTYVQVPDFSVVPEPASLVIWGLLGLALGGASWWRRGRARATIDRQT
jgi:hypothetical protein